MKKTTTKKVAAPKTAVSKKAAKETADKPVKKTVGTKKIGESTAKTVKKIKQSSTPEQHEAATKKVVAKVSKKVAAPVASEVVAAAPVAEVPESTPRKVAPAVQPEKHHVARKAVQKSRKPETLALGVGRRKEAVARVWVKLGSGKLTINQHPHEKYFTTQTMRLSATMPFRIIERAQHYDVYANVVGGGVGAQADAVRLGFSRALLALNEEWRSPLRAAGLLTVDSRQKERKKYGQKGARRKFQFVKR